MCPSIVYSQQSPLLHTSIKNNTRINKGGCNCRELGILLYAYISVRVLKITPVGQCFEIMCYLCRKSCYMDKHIVKWLPGENPVGDLFNEFPELNVRQVARAMGINETLMQQYVNGAKRPTAERRMEIELFLHKLATRLSKIKL